MQARQREAKVKQPAKRKLPFDPTPQKAPPKDTYGLRDKENQVNKASLQAKVVAAPPASKTRDESFQLDFTTFIDRSHHGAPDVTLSPESFNLSDLSSHENSTASPADVTGAVAGETATTFVLENNFRKEPDTATQMRLAAAVRVREEAERQKEEAERHLQSLRERSKSPQAKVVEKSDDDDDDDEGVEDSPASAPAPAPIKADARAGSKDTERELFAFHKPGKDQTTKTRQLLAMKSMDVQTSKRSAPVVAIHQPIDGAHPLASKISKPMRIKMLRAASTMSMPNASAEGLDFRVRSPSTTLGARQGSATAGGASMPEALFRKMELSDGRQTIHASVWPGDEMNESGDVLQPIPPSASSSSISASEEGDEERDSTARALIVVPPNDCDEDESMDPEMLDATTVLDRTVANARYSILQAPVARGVLDISLPEAQSMMSQQLGAAQLDCVMKDKNLEGLFGEHLKRQREDALLRILDEIRDLADIQRHADRLSNTRAVFQMFLADKVARENHISLSVVSADLRKATRKRIHRGECGPEVFSQVVEAIKTYLATEEIPKFVACDLYKTLAFKPGRKGARRQVDRANFAAPPPVQIVVPSAAMVVSKTQEEDNDEDEEEEESSQVDAEISKPQEASLDAVLSDPQELETYISFVASTDEHAARRTENNVEFLKQVAQFNRAPEEERPRVARTIWREFLDSDASRRDQKGQVEVDITLLRKNKVVDQCRRLFEAAEPSVSVAPGFFDKAARDVSAMVEPTYARYLQAKRSGSHRLVQKARFANQNGAASVIPSCERQLPELGLCATLENAIEEGGAVLEAFVGFASDVGHQRPATFLQRVAKFRRESDAKTRTQDARSIIEEFVEPNGKHALSLPPFLCSGLIARWGSFQRMHLIKPDFFDAAASEISRSLGADTWPRFVAECSRQASSRAEAKVESEDDFVEFGRTLGRAEVEEEYKRMLREDVANDNEDDDDDSDEGIEDSPDVAPPRMSGTAARRHITKPVDTLDLSPGTAADLLSRLADAPPAKLYIKGSAVDDTVILKQQATLPMARDLFAKEAVPTHQQHRPVQVVIRQEASLQVPPPNPLSKLGSSYVWPSRTARMFFGEGLDGKRRARYVVLKNKSLYVWKSEARYRANKDPVRALDMDHLLRCNVVRSSHHNALLGPKMELRLYFKGLESVVALGSDSESVLLDWKRALLESAPHLAADK